MAILIALMVVGWVAVALLGTQAYFLGEQSKPVHARNWQSPQFHALAVTVTGNSVDYAGRASSYQQDRYLSRLLDRVNR